MRLISALILGLVSLIATAPAAAQQPGVLLSANEMSDEPEGMQAWRIRYTSTNDRGQAEEVTGVVIAPTGMPSRMGRPVLAWAHGTWGVAGKCTFADDKTFFKVTPGLQSAIARGYVVVATDYAGLGTPQPHPYLVGASAAHSVLDAVRAARAIPEAGSSNRFATWGESQGGHASLWAGQLARSYAPDLNLIAVAAAAPPTDLIENLTGGSDPSIRAFLTAFTADSWSRHYGISLRTLGNKSTAGLITRLARNNCISLTAKPKLGTVIGIVALRRQLKGVDLGKISPWAELARDNSVAVRDYGAPFFIAQNQADVIVSPAITKEFVLKMCRAGARLRFVPMTTPGGHPTSAADSTEAMLDWLDARFAGDRAPSDCGSI